MGHSGFDRPKHRAKWDCGKLALCFGRGKIAIGRSDAAPIRENPPAADQKNLAKLSSPPRNYITGW
jgi:hypothetical protein